MFYSLEEAAEKLGKTAEQVKQLAKDGKIREFRDGPNLLFKVDEVDALVEDTGESKAEESSVELNLEQEQPESEKQPETPDQPEEPQQQQPQAERTAEVTEKPAEEQPEESGIQLAEPAEASEEESDLEKKLKELDESSADESQQQQQGESEEKDEPSKEQSKEPEISLAETSGEETAFAEDLESSKVSPPEGETSILGETETEPAMEQKQPQEKQKDESAEASLEEIEEDVNLDTFGSGSGLLDLSLQADDTSLGGVLDEIYSPEGQEENAPEKGAEVGAAIEAEQMLPEGGEEQVGPAAAAPAYVEPPPDAFTNALGFTLFIPLVALIYTAIVVIGGWNGLLPLAAIHQYIWYIVIAAVILAGVIPLTGFMMTRSREQAGKKKPKTKKAKPPKIKKKK